jgi:DNA-binding MarR family transcriptional regulator
MANVKTPRIQDEELKLADAMVMAAIRLTRTLRAQNRSAELSGPQISALAAIVYSTQITARDLAKLEEVTPATISRLLASMEAAGLISRTRDENDTRLYWIHATADGRRVIEQGHRKRLMPLALVIGSLSAQERRNLASSAEVWQRLIRELG